MLFKNGCILIFNVLQDLQSTSVELFTIALENWRDGLSSSTSDDKKSSVSYLSSLISYKLTYFTYFEYYGWSDNFLYY